MMYSNRVCQKLHDEHMATLALLERLERLVASNKPPEANDTSMRSLLIDLAVAFETEIWRHFAFEEKYLFDYFAQSGDTEMAQPSHNRTRANPGRRRARHRHGAGCCVSRIFAAGMERVPPSFPGNLPSN